jgi:hypothetical protein
VITPQVKAQLNGRCKTIGDTNRVHLHAGT